MDPIEATDFTLDRVKDGKDTISVTGNVLRDERFYTYKFIHRNCTTMVADEWGNSTQSGHESEGQRLAGRDINDLNPEGDSQSMRGNNQDRMFGVFFRLNSKDDYEGTGLGLALCRKIVHRHGGEIYAESVEGKGASFHVLLPV